MVTAPALFYQLDMTDACSAQLRILSHSRVTSCLKYMSLDLLLTGFATD